MSDMQSFVDAVSHAVAMAVGAALNPVNEPSEETKALLDQAPRVLMCALQSVSDPRAVVEKVGLYWPSDKPLHPIAGLFDVLRRLVADGHLGKFRELSTLLADGGYAALDTQRAWANVLEILVVGCWAARSYVRRVGLGLVSAPAGLAVHAPAHAHLLVFEGMEDGELESERESESEEEEEEEEEDPVDTLCRYVEAQYLYAVAAVGDMGSAEWAAKCLRVYARRAGDYDAEYAVASPSVGVAALCKMGVEALLEVHGSHDPNPTPLRVETYRALLALAQRAVVMAQALWCADPCWARQAHMLLAAVDLHCSVSEFGPVQVVLEEEECVAPMRCLLSVMVAHAHEWGALPTLHCQRQLLRQPMYDADVPTILHPSFVTGVAWPLCISLRAVGMNPAADQALFTPAFLRALCALEPMAPMHPYLDMPTSYAVHPVLEVVFRYEPSVQGCLRLLWDLGRPTGRAHHVPLSPVAVSDAADSEGEAGEAGERTPHPLAHLLPEWRTCLLEVAVRYCCNINSAMLRAFVSDDMKGMLARDSIRLAIDLATAAPGPSVTGPLKEAFQRCAREHTAMWRDPTLQGSLAALMAL
jgi:hypothetical protein